MAKIVRSERRDDMRHAIGLRCQVVRERDFKLVSDRTLDLSERGACVAATTRVLTGEPVLVSFKLRGSARWIDVEATVVRVVHGRRTYDGSAGLGLAFHGVDAPTARAIAASLRGVAPPVPPHLRARAT